MTRMLYIAIVVLMADNASIADCDRAGVLRLLCEGVSYNRYLKADELMSIGVLVDFNSMTMTSDLVREIPTLTIDLANDHKIIASGDRTLGGTRDSISVDIDRTTGHLDAIITTTYTPLTDRGFDATKNFLYGDARLNCNPAHKKF